MALIVIERLAVMSFIPYTLKNTLQMTCFFFLSYFALSKCAIKCCNVVFDQSLVVKFVISNDPEIFSYKHELISKFIYLFIF